MRITVEINGETWTYIINNPDIGGVDFMDAVIPIESLLRAIYPTFGNHVLNVRCPNGEDHDPDEDCEFIQELEADSVDDDKDLERTDEIKDKGIELPPEDGGKDSGKKDTGL